MKPEELVFLVDALSQISIIDSILGGLVGGGARCCYEH